MKDEHSLMLIYKCEQCGAREMRTKMFRSPKVTMPASPREIAIIHVIDVGGRDKKDAHWEPLEFLHHCRTLTPVGGGTEEVFGLCKFIGYSKKEQ